MKNWIILAGCALLALSCNLDNKYTETNAQEFVSVVNGSIYSDYGVQFVVKGDNTDGKWKDLSRLFLTFDITAASTGSYETLLKSYAPVDILTATPATPEDPLGDPIYAIGSTSISGGYLNIYYGWSTLKESTASHKIRVTFQDQPATRILNFTLIHDADGESEVVLPDEGKTVEAHFLSIPLKDLVAAGEQRSIALTFTSFNASAKEEEDPVYQQTINLTSNVLF